MKKTEKKNSKIVRGAKQREKHFRKKKKMGLGRHQKPGWWFGEKIPILHYPDSRV